MTNEVACAAGSAAGVTDRIAQEFGAQIGQGQELWNQILAWLSEKGVSFAINVVTAILILIVGALVIKLIRGTVARALAKVNKMSKLLLQ